MAAESERFFLQGDPTNAAPMAHYMKDRFPFLGVKTPERKRQLRPLLAASRTWSTEALRAAVAELYARPEREYQYAAIDLASARVQQWTLTDMRWLADFVSVKAWWDSVDAWRMVFGRYIARHPADKAAMFDWFFGQDDFWLRRVGITLQLMEKQQTDTAMLARAILADRTTPEFFIQKAIGWALRQYSKTDAAWVRAFMGDHELMPLAVREGSKYL
ncbi:DNA alkylation repair protein [Lacticaseibacillus mingshuiensis]|uniref:DNA alkylation repair protein n=1 Tax=Lacticaseibacillus mingshuiensis TaxID=2799574 RepID=UPI001942BA86|nr:DNA alkylation repair protein [Lacticaseibacillus mingshuiensis]